VEKKADATPHEQPKQKKKIAAVAVTPSRLNMALRPALIKQGFQPIFITRSDLPSCNDLRKLEGLTAKLAELQPSVAILAPTAFFGINNGVCQNLSQKLDRKCRIICLLTSKDGPEGNMVRYAAEANVRYVKLSPDYKASIREILASAK
jgi:hypothetical protein